MKQNKWMKKRLAVALIAVTSMVGTTVPLLANDTNTQTMQISQWSIGTLNEGEKYGIFPITWYYEDFKGTISKEKLQSLLNATSKKIGDLGLKTKENFVPEQVILDSTRGTVVTSLYNIIAKYELPQSLGAAGCKPEEYFQKRGFLNGTGKSLELDKACTVEQAAVLATKIVEDTYDAVGGGSKGLLWKASKGNNTVYLLGSIHIGDTSLYPFDKKLKEVFKESSQLIVEANLMNQEGYNDFAAQSMYSDGTTLKDHVSKETYEKVLKVFEKLGLKEEECKRVKPWSLANTFSVVTSSDSASLEESNMAALLGIDRYFTTSALVTQKPIIELEGLKYQAELFNNLSADTQEQFLNAAADAILNPKTDGSNKEAELLMLWQKQWQRGDIDSLKVSYSESLGNEENEITKMIFGKRDQAMAAKISEMLEEDGKNTYFVVVGAGHLVVKDTVIDTLRSKGYTVEIVR